ncbi:MAG: hypothetical protein AB1640_00490 [bacterium]
MTKLIRLLGSLEWTLILMVLVCVWFAVGGILAVSSQYGNTVRALNDQLAARSLSELPHLEDPIWSPYFNWTQIQKDMVAGLPHPERTVRAWLWGAFILALLLGVNLILATWDWVVDLFRRRLDLRRYLLLGMHVLFGVVLAGHLASAALGFKKVGQVPVRVGERIEFLNRYALSVDRVETIEQKDGTGNAAGKAWMTPDLFVRQPVRVLFTLYDNGEAVHSGEVAAYHSDAFDGMQIHLAPFSFRSQVSHDFTGRGVGPQVVISRNPGVPIMLLFQPIWILVLLVYVLVTFRSHTES